MQPCMQYGRLIVENVHEEGMGWLVTIATEIQKRATPAKPKHDFLGPLTLLEFVRRSPDMTYRWVGGDLSLKLQVGLLTIISREWHAQFWYDHNNGKKAVRVIGDPEAFAVDFHKLVPYADEETKLVISVETKYLQDPYNRRPIPGKKKPREKVATDQSEVGGTVIPLFGRPETGKKPRKGK